MKKLFGIIAALALTACTNAANGPVVHVGEFEVERLFTHEGCTVYRFGDAGHFRYFAKCVGAASSETSSTYSCGKSCARDESLPTGYVAGRDEGTQVSVLRQVDAITEKCCAEAQAELDEIAQEESE